MSCPCGGRHPALARPVSGDVLEAELVRLQRRTVGILSEPRLLFERGLSRTHRRSARRYAESQVGPKGSVIYVAPEILWLPAAFRRGILAHELGHLLLNGFGSEAGADIAALEWLGFKIGYDKRWGGRGLQCAR